MKRWIRNMEPFDRWAMITVAICMAYLGWQCWIRRV